MAEIPVWKYGTGKLTLVLVHGGPSLSRYMQTLGELLQERYTIVEYLQQADSLKELLGELQFVVNDLPKNRILIGHSWGATLINLFLEGHTEKAIFIDPAPLSDENAKKFSENLLARMPEDLRKKLDELKTKTEKADKAYLQELMQKRLELISPYYHKDPASDKALGSLLWNFHSFCQIMDEVWDLIDKGLLGPRVSVPVLHGSHDPIPALPHAIIIDNSGHFPWLENKKAFMTKLDKMILTI